MINPSGWGLTPGTAAAPISALAGSHRPSFVHHQRSTQQLLAIATVHGSLRRGVIVNFDKPKTAGLPGKAIAHDSYRVHRDPLIGEEVLHIRFIRRIRKIPHEKLLHSQTLLL